MWNFLESSSHEDGVIVTVGLIFSEEQAKDAIYLSNIFCNGEHCSFLLDPKLNPPRVRVYETVIPEANLEKAKRKTEDLCKIMIPFPMEWGTIEMQLHFAALWGELNKPLELFHDAVVEAINPLREGYYKVKYSNSNQALSLEEKTSLLQWGSPWVSPYSPHMILAKAEKTFNNTYHPNIEWPHHKCMFSGVLFGTKKNKALESFEEIPFAKS